jgi:dihydroorotate dehydrogenase electron transfer subunit
LLRFESETPLRVLPGQFTMVRVAGGGLLRRPYSFCDHLEDGAFTLLVKEVGVGTRALMKLPVGGTVSSLGPLGTTFDPPPPDRTPVIVAGGVGIAPFVLFCRRLAENGRRGIVLLGGRRRPDLYLWDTFERLGMDVRVASEDGSAGRRGYVTALLDAALADAGEPILYSCGPTGMLLRVAELATAADVPHQVSIERRMGCGMGCCLGCVVWARPAAGGPEEYLRSCTEGPVFDAATIDWDKDPNPL